LTLHRPRKSLGQNFLADRTVPPRIADAASIEPGDYIVEVGPGLGVLTEELAGRLDPDRGGKLVAIELDRDLLPVLQERFADWPQVALMQGDVLDISPGELSGGRAYKLVANLPYYITSAVLRHFLETRDRPRTLVVMVQREVAERIAASPPDMSLLAVSVQFYGKPKIMFRVPPGAFRPTPKVESAVVRVDVYPPGETPVSPEDEEHFFRVVRAGFSQKRKQLGNTLSTALGIPKPDVAMRLQSAGIDPQRRAETLSLQEWGRVEAGMRAED
jgi:16S rRNA (adenine1518-N6/adenine1519-N6)-dimethyltransferase